ncbi:translocated intimin receptor Tir [Edaphobacter aggregans]|nr:translocated intimin receptor Tir [Edaphobacter aggregans]
MNDERERSVRTGGTTRAVLTDSHFWVPFLALVAGIALLAVLHKA